MHILISTLKTKLLVHCTCMLGRGDNVTEAIKGTLPINRSEKYRSCKTIISLIVLAMMQWMLLTATASTADASFEVATFSKDVEEFRVSITARYPVKSIRNEQWLIITSPWHPYLQRQFVDGLDKSSEHRHNGYVEQGNCEEAARLEMIGMFELYPHLRAVFDDSKIRLLFSKVIFPQFSFADNRCKAIRIISPLIREAKLMSADRGKHFNAYEVQLHISNAVYQSTQSVNLDEMQLTNAVHTLEKLALCHHYQPAMVDLVQFEDDLPFVRISGSRGYYFSVLAKKVGIGGVMSSIKVAGFLSDLERRKISGIKKTFEIYSLEHASNVLSYREFACRLSLPQLP